jgi:hypothetical protein
VYLATGQEFTGQTEGFCVGTETANCVLRPKLKVLWGKHCVANKMGKDSTSNTEFVTLCFGDIDSKANFAGLVRKRRRVWGRMICVVHMHR